MAADPVTAADKAAGVEAVIRILGYNLLPFVEVQQQALQQSLVADLKLQSQVRTQYSCVRPEVSDTSVPTLTLWPI